MRVLVTGAGGFVGRHLLPELQAHGHDVVGTDRRGDVSRMGDLADHDFRRRLLEETSPEAVIHLAGWAHVGKSWDSPGRVMEANIVLSTDLLHEAAALSTPPRSFLHVSSAEVFGEVTPGELPLTERSPARPGTPYAVSKHAAEQALGLLAARGGIRLVVARPFNHIGRGQAPEFACPSFARQVAEIEAGQRSVLRHGNLAARRDFLDVRDVVRAYRLLIEASTGAPCYVISSGTSHAMEDIVRRLFALAGLEPVMEQDPALFRPRDPSDLRGDSTLLRDHLGWHPMHTLDESLAEVLDEARRGLQRL